MDRLSTESLYDLSDFLGQKFGIKSFVWSHESGLTAQRLHVWGDPMLLVLCPTFGIMLLDLNFADKFKTRHYNLSGPVVFLGTRAELIAVVKQKGREMEETFIMHGQHVPPWRRTKNILSLYEHVFARASEAFKVIDQTI